MPTIDEMLEAKYAKLTPEERKKRRRRLLMMMAWYADDAGGVGGADTVAPTFTSPDTATVEENATLSHSLTTNEAASFTIVGGADQARFEISGSTLRWASNGTKDYENPNDANTDNVYVVTVRATDLASNTTDQTISVTVTDVSEGAAAGDSLLLFNSQGITMLHLGLI